MASKRDIRQIEQVAAEFGMDPDQRHRFGEFVEQKKRQGERGTANERGDFTWKELRDVASEFLNAE